MKRNKNWLFPVCFFLIIIVIVMVGINSSESGNNEEEMKRLENSIQNAIVECYANEGSYPKSIAYLKENYGIYVNEDKYSIIYELEGSNIKPNVRIFRRGDYNE